MRNDLEPVVLLTFFPECKSLKNLLPWLSDNSVVCSFRVREPSKSFLPWFSVNNVAYSSHFFLSLSLFQSVKSHKSLFLWCVSKEFSDSRFMTSHYHLWFKDWSSCTKLWWDTTDAENNVTCWESRTVKVSVLKVWSRSEDICSFIRFTCCRKFYLSDFGLSGSFSCILPNLLPTLSDV